jgi:GxxExxY protein
MAMALMDMGLQIQRELPIQVTFRGLRVGTFRADIVVEGKVLLELKTGPKLDALFEVQLLNYLYATDLEVGLVLHFGRRASFSRFIATNDQKRRRAR